jgi:actin-like ATPase involved in cell morphogenesis
VVDRSARLGIDFGTSTTVAVISLDEREPRPLLFDGSPLLPSAVCVDPTGRLVVGRDAVHMAIATPAAFEPHPKQRVDEATLLLGGTEIGVEALFEAVLRRVIEEAARVADGAPTEIVITHPAAWGGERKAVLQRAAPPNTVLVPEPVAAAHYFVEVAGHKVPEGRTAIVYDFGAGTFDASLVQRIGDGFVVSAAKGLPDSGGLDIDAAIIGYLHQIVAGDEIWARLNAPQNLTDRRAARQLWDNVRAGKEMLSRSTQTLIHLPLFDTEVVLGREQIEELAAPILERTIQTTRDLLAGAGVAASDVAAVFLAGGSSRMPAVATALHRALGLPPSIVEQPEVVVAEGSLRAIGPPPEDAWPPVAPVEIAPPKPGRRRLLVAAGVAVAVLLAGGAALASTLSGDSETPVQPASSPSKTYPPGIDPCLLGTWVTERTSLIAKIDGTDVTYTGGAGALTTFKEDGTYTGNDWNSAPVTAIYSRATWVMTFRGSTRGRYFANGETVRWTERVGDGTVVLTRDGRFNNSAGYNQRIEPSGYRCTGDRLETWSTEDQYASVSVRVKPPSASPSGVTSPGT